MTVKILLIYLILFAISGTLAVGCYFLSKFYYERFYKNYKVNFIALIPFVLFCLFTLLAIYCVGAVIVVLFNKIITLNGALLLGVVL